MPAGSCRRPQWDTSDKQKAFPEPVAKLGGVRRDRVDGEAGGWSSSKSVVSTGGLGLGVPPLASCPASTSSTHPPLLLLMASPAVGVAPTQR